MTDQLHEPGTERSESLNRPSGHLYPGTVPASWYLLIALAVLLAHGASLIRDLVWDDVLMVEYLSQTGFWSLFEPDSFGFVRPGKTLLFSLLHSLFGTWGPGWQAAGLAILIATCLLLFRFLAVWLPPFAALIGTLAYAVHPLHVEGTGWPSASNGTWMTAFALGYDLLFTRPVRERAALWPLSTVLFLAALMMKEEAIVLPVIGGLVLYFSWGNIGRREVLLLGSHLALAGVFVLFTRAQAAEVGQQLNTFPIPGWMITLGSPRVMLSHAFFYFVPFTWRYYTAFNYEPVRFLSLAALSLAVVAALLAVVWRHRRERRPVDLAILFFLVAMLPLANFLPMGNDHFAVRYLTHAGVALALATGWLVSLAIDRWRHWTLALVTGTWLLAAVIASALFHYQWRSTVPLFRAILDHNDAAWARVVLAGWLSRPGIGDFSGAAAEARQAVEVLEKEVAAGQTAPRVARMIRVRSKLLEGQALMQQGRLLEAGAVWQQAVEIDPKDADAALHYANFQDEMYSRTKDRRHFQQAEKYYQTALSGATSGETAYVNLGLLYVMDNQTTRGVAVWRDGLARRPGSEKLRNNLAVAARSQKTEGAR